MNINKVSQITGVDSKTIRYYEKEGLLEVKRSLNGYRSFSQENIDTIALIKLLRFFDLSIEEIRMYINSKLSLEEIKKIAEEIIEKLKDKTIERENTIHLLSKDNLESYLNNPEIIKEYTDKDMIIEKAFSFKISSLVNMFYYFLGPFLLLIYFSIVDKSTSRPLSFTMDFIFILSILYMSASFVELFDYREPYRAYKKFFKVVIIIFNFLTLLFLQEKYALHIFTDTSSIALSENSQIIVFLMILSIVFYTFSLIQKNQKVRLFAFLFLFIGLFLSITNRSDIKEDGSIIRYTPLNLKGKVYTVDDIQKVEIKSDKRGKNYRYYIYYDDYKIDAFSVLRNEYDGFEKHENLDQIYRNQQVERIINIQGECRLNKDECESLEIIQS